MEEKRDLVRSYVAVGLNLEICLTQTDLPRSTYYYRSTGGVKGKKASTHTVYQDSVITNGQVVDKIKWIMNKPFIDYGYKKMTTELKRLGYQIGKSKVYRLMKENGLLQASIKPKPRNSRFRTWKTPRPNAPFELLEMDIKYIWVSGMNRYSYLVTLFDTFNLMALSWGLNYSMKTREVKQVVLKMIDNHLLPQDIDPKTISLHLRTDNGSQFRSQEYLKLLDDLGIQAQYIPNATPQLNGHIEGFYSLVSKLVCRTYQFQSIKEARTVFESFFYVYNHERMISTLADHSPVEFTRLWKQGRIGMKEVNGKRKYFLKGEDSKKSLLPSRLF